MSGIVLSRNGFYKCRQGDEVRFQRSIPIGSSASGTSNPEPEKFLEVIIDPADWRCPEGWELAGGFVDLEGLATNAQDQTASGNIYILQ